ncbi:MAG: gluconate 2-dehydrogenase subunit 3 family protein [Bacteroidota bacterium]
MNRREALKNTALFMGYAVSASSLATLMSGCQTEGPTTSEWKPEFLTADQYTTVSEMTETILPRTQTPGAKDVGVAQFIDKLLKNCTEEKNRQAFTQGLDAFMAKCQKDNGKSFADSQAEKRNEIVGQLEAEMMALRSDPARADDAPTPFYETLKSLAMTGYFSSEKIGKEVLRYDPVPGPYQGCIPYKEGEHTWAF